MKSPKVWLERQAECNPGAAALILEGDRLDWELLHQRVNGVCARLSAAGLRPGETLTVAVHDPLLITLLLHATPRLGCALQVVNPDLPPDWAAGLLAAAGSAKLVADAGLGAKGKADVLPAEELLAAAPQPSFASAAAPLPPEAVHLILATSGTEGEPKGVCLTGRNLMAAVLASRQRLGLERGDRWLDCLPLFHMGGLSILLRCAQAGATVVLHPCFDVERVARELGQEAISHVSLVPAMLARLLDVVPEGPPESLRVALIGGAALPASLARRALESGWPLCASYGLTETASQVATRCRLTSDWREGAVGQPLEGFEVRIVDDAGCVTDGIGRIQVRGEAVMYGYGNPEGLPGVGLEAGWFTTGDLGMLCPDGLTVFGRADDVMVSGGENIHPAAVEAQMLACAGLKEVAVVGRPDPVWGARLVALYVGEIQPQELDGWCRMHLPALWRPREFQPVDRLPRNAMGKLQREKLVSLLGGPFLNSQPAMLSRAR